MPGPHPVLAHCEPMGDYWDFDEADAFATGAIGQPGERVFYLQVRADGRTVCMKCEKTQVAELARYMRNFLSDLPEVHPAADGNASLVSPVEQDFVLGSIGLGIDRASSRVVVQLEELVMVDDDDDAFDLVDDEDDPSSVVRVMLTAAQARAFCEVAERVVGSGRETCRWCGAPMDPAGHACPRFN